MLNVLHERHWGIVRMKQLAQRYVQWPNINRDIENLLQICTFCRQVSKAPASNYLPWPDTKCAWERIHVDYAGPFCEKMWLICIDAHFKYPFVVMRNIGQTTPKKENAIDSLQQIFSLEGLPDTLLTDNGSQFVSDKFNAFCIELNIKHLTTLTYHNASNGKAERFVQTFKREVDKKRLFWFDLCSSVGILIQLVFRVGVFCRRYRRNHVGGFCK